MPIKIDPENQNRYFEVPYEPSEEALEAYRQKKADESLRMTRFGASNRDWGPRPEYAPAPEGAVEELPWGGEYQPATEMGPGGVRKFSNIPSDEGDPTVGYIKEPEKKKKPSPWIGQDMSPAKFEEFKQHVIDTQFKGKDWSTVNKYTAADEELAKDNMDRDQNPEQWARVVKRIGDQQDYYFKLMKNLKDDWDKAAAENEKVRKRKQETEKKQTEKVAKQKTLYVDLGEKRLKLLQDKAKLADEFNKMRDELGPSPSDEEFGASRGKMKSITDRAAAIDEQIKVIDNQRSEIAKEYTVEIPGTPGGGRPKPKKAAEPEDISKGFSDPLDVVRQFRNGALGDTGDPAVREKAKEIIRHGVETKGWSDPSNISQPPQQAATSVMQMPKETPAGQTARTKSVDTAKDGKVLSMPEEKAAPIKKPNKTISIPRGRIGPKPPTSAMKYGIINTKSFSDFFNSIGISKQNFKLYEKIASDIGGFAVDQLYDQPKETIKSLFKKAVASQKKSQKSIGM